MAYLVIARVVAAAATGAATVTVVAEDKITIVAVTAVKSHNNSNREHPLPR